jgi:hypothetical protein
VDPDMGDGKEWSGRRWMVRKSARLEPFLVVVVVEYNEYRKQNDKEGRKEEEYNQSEEDRNKKEEDHSGMSVMEQSVS